MKKILLSSLIAFSFILISTGLKAQYKHALGVRLGEANGVTYKTFIQSDRALDFILNVESNKRVSIFRFTGLYELHNPINSVPGLKWYYGGGGTLGSYRIKKIDESDIYLSADGVLGLDYKLDGVPINASLDWKPALRLTQGADFETNGFGLSIRITF